MLNIFETIESIPISIDNQNYKHELSKLLSNSHTKQTNQTNKCDFLTFNAKEQDKQLCKFQINKDSGSHNFDFLTNEKKKLNLDVNLNEHYRDVFHLNRETKPKEKITRLLILSNHEDVSDAKKYVITFNNNHKDVELDKLEIVLMTNSNYIYHLDRKNNSWRKVTFATYLETFEFILDNSLHSIGILYNINVQQLTFSQKYILFNAQAHFFENVLFAI